MTAQVVHFPAEPAGPYQPPLLRELRREGIRAGYLPDPAGALPGGPALRGALRVALLPLVLVAVRARGAQVVHLHWTYAFIPGPRTPRTGRRLARAWFELCLALARRVGLRLAWTAHNVLPHDPIFDDDGAARRALLARADAVIVHHPATADELAAFGRPRRLRVIPQGMPEHRLPARDAARAALGIGRDRLLVVSLGRIAAYKGLEAGLDAIAMLAPEERERIAVLVAGECVDQALAARLRDRAEALDCVSLDLRRLSEEELALRLAAADAALLPFASIDNSGAVASALAAGLPLVIPDHAGLGDVPAGAAIRYPAGGGAEECAVALGVLIARSEAAREAMRAAARGAAAERTWSRAAASHAALYRDLGA